MGSDSNHDGHGHLPGLRCFHKRQSSVREMADEEDPMCARTEIVVKLYDDRRDSRHTVKIEPSPRPSSTSPLSTSVISVSDVDLFPSRF